MPVETAKSILDKTIKNFVCIDDEFSAPFDSDVNELAQNMYNTFHSKYKNIKILKYKDDMGVIDIKNYFSNADIVILDWDLSKSNENINLELLIESLQEHHVKYIFIYTHNKKEEDTKGIEDIRHKLFMTFGDYLDIDELEATKQSFVSQIEEQDWLSEDEIEELFQLYQSEYLGMMQIGVDLRHIEDELLKKVTEFNDEVKKSDICRFLNQNYKNYHQIFQSEVRKNILGNLSISLMPFEIKDLQNDKYIINGKLLHIISKSSAEPQQLLELIYEYISKEVDSFFSILNHEVLALFKSHFFYRAKEIAQIHGSVIKEYTDLNQDKPHALPLDDLVKGVYSDIFMSVLRNNKLSFLEKAKDYLEMSDSDYDVDKEIKKINCFISIDHMAKDIVSFRTERKIDFGDIFEIVEENDSKSSNKFAICITPQCDCANPEDNIKHTYSFAISSQELSLEDHNLDGSFCSFIPMEKEIKIIQWNGGEFVKSNQILIDKGTNDINRLIEGNDVRNKYKFKFVAQQKENFTQRLVNESSRRGIRVGVSYLNKISNDSESNEESTLQGCNC